MLESIFQYTDFGWPVFPVAVATKAPLTPRGHKDATTDREQILAWWSQWPDAAIGIPTGERTGVVVDIDERNGGFKEAAFLEGVGAGLSATLTALTGGNGFHHWFSSPPGEPIPCKNGFLPGIDIKGEGGYVIVPPSRHVSGGVYHWDGLFNPEAMKPFPAILRQGLRQAPSVLETAGGDDGVMFGEGNRNRGLTAVAGRLQRGGLLTFEVLMNLNDVKCDPPLHAHEVRKIYESISRKPIADPVGGDTPPELMTKASGMVEEMFHYLSDENQSAGTRTLIDGLDALLGGGCRLGELTGLCASAKSGKSSFFHYRMSLWLKAGIPVGYASREMRPATEVLPNILSSQFGENAWDSSLLLGRKEKYTEAVKSWPLYFTRGYGPINSADIREWVKTLKGEYGVQHFFIDHLHFCLEEPEEFKYASKFAQDLKRLVNEENVHIDIIIQPTKLADGAQLNFNNMRGGAGISQALDNVFIFERFKHEGIGPNISRLKLELARHKRAKMGESVYLQYERDTTRFIEVTIEPEAVAEQPTTPSRPALGESWRLGLVGRQA